VDPVTIEKGLGGLGDWIRFSPWQWFVFSSYTKERIGLEVRKGLQPADQVIVTVVQPEYGQGAAAQWIWEWLNDRMQRMLNGPT
jgi:hypothetical protein